MKNSIRLFFFAIALVLASQSQAAVAVDGADLTGISEFQGMSAEEFVNLTPKQIETMTGREMSFKEALAIKKAQKMVKKNMDGASGPKSQIVALLLVIFVGYLGIHRFYLGYTGAGIIQLLTGGGCGIWALIDLVRIATGELGPKDGSAYDPTL